MKYFYKILKFLFRTSILNDYQRIMSLPIFIVNTMNLACMCLVLFQLIDVSEYILFKTKILWFMVPFKVFWFHFQTIARGANSQWITHCINWKLHYFAIDILILLLWRSFNIKGPGGQWCHLQCIMVWMASGNTKTYPTDNDSSTKTNNFNRILFDKFVNGKLQRCKTILMFMNLWWE